MGGAHETNQQRLHKYGERQIDLARTKEIAIIPSATTNASAVTQHYKQRQRVLKDNVTYTLPVLCGDLDRSNTCESLEYLPLLGRGSTYSNSTLWSLAPTRARESAPTFTRSPMSSGAGSFIPRTSSSFPSFAGSRGNRPTLG